MTQKEACEKKEQRKMEGTEFYDFKSCLLSNRLHVNKTVQRFSDDFWGEAARGKKKNNNPDVDCWLEHTFPRWFLERGTTLRAEQGDPSYLTFSDLLNSWVTISFFSIC